MIVYVGSALSEMVVYENAYGDDIWFPDRSVTAIVTVTLYAAENVWPLVLNIAWLPLHVESVHPGLSEVIFVVLTVVQSTSSSHPIMTLLFKATLVVP